MMEDESDIISLKLSSFSEVVAVVSVVAAAVAAAVVAVSSAEKLDTVAASEVVGVRPL